MLGGLALLAAGLIGLFYLASLHAVGGNSDGATVVLEGQSMQAGNLALNGWSLSVDSFWSVDAIFYAIGVALAGVAPVLLNLVPAILACATVIVASVMVLDAKTRSMTVVGGAVVVAYLVFPTPDLEYFYLQGPLHVGTTLWCLLAFLSFRRNRLDGWWLAAVLLLGTGILGDLQIVALGTVPVFVAGLLAALRARRLRAGLPSALGALATIGAAYAIRFIAHAFGTFRFGGTHRTTPVSAYGQNLVQAFDRSLELLGVKFTPIWAATSQPAIVRAAHLVAFVVLVAGLLTCLLDRFVLANLSRPRATDALHGDSLDDLLVIAAVADIGVYVLLAVTQGNYSRYLVPGIIFAAIATARLVARLSLHVHRRLPRTATALIGCWVIATIGVQFGYDLTLPNARRPEQALGQFLEAKHFRLGLADYPSSSILTVETKDSVKLRPVVAGTKGKLVRFERQSDDAWYRRQRFEFLVFNAKHPWRGVNEHSAALTFGTPSASYRVGDFEVLTWKSPLSIAVHGSTGVDLGAPKR